MRRYDKGEIVGTIEPPIPFDEWMRRQREALDAIRPESQLDLAYVNGRRGMLTEAAYAWERAQELKADPPKEEP